MTQANNRKPLTSWSQHICGAVGKVLRQTSAFFSDRRGNVAMLVGLTGIPLVVAAGAGIDYARAVIVQQRLSHALDSAALAVGTSLEKSEDDLKQLAQAYFNANFPSAEMGVPGTLTVTISGDKVTMSADAVVDTSVMGIVGFHNIAVASDTEVIRKITGLELVMVLDNTGSMGSNGKISALKTAATDLVNIVFGEEDETEYLKVGLVPFASAVNVGTENRNSGWIDTNAQSSLHDLNFDFDNMPGVNTRFDVFDLISNKDWNGCVEARPMPYDILDTPPDGTDGDTLWVPYFAPDEPDHYSYNNNYLSDQTTGNAPFRQRYLPKYNNASVSGDGPHFNCNTRPITPLTNKKSEVLNAIDDMNATGTTNIPFGMAWGWRVISPGEPFSEGVSYSDPDYNKVIILLTDGQNVIGSRNTHNRSQYGGYGFVRDGASRLGTTYSNTAQNRLDEKTRDVCENIKNANTSDPIIVYTITFQLSDGPTKDMMRNCASDPEKYFDSVSNAVLKEHFEAIANELSDLRITK